MNILDFSQKHAGQGCFILGSGPSLASMDLSVLRDEVTFSCNRGYLLFERLGFPTTYWVIEDALDAAQYHAETIALPSTKFVPDDLLGYAWGSVVPTPFVRGPFDSPKFSATPPFEWGGTVVHLMIQIAAHMGCSPIYLLGNDFRWSDLKPVLGVCTTDRDVDHFDSQYWPEGFQSYPPNPLVMRRAFVEANRARRRIVNLTPGSALDVFEVGELGFSHPRPAMEQHASEIEPFSARVLALNPKNVVEIGVRAGGTSALWHDLCSGSVIGVDREPNAALTARFPRFRNVVGNSHDPSTVADVERLLSGEQADLLFIDGDHSFAGTKSDYEMYQRFVRPGGLIAFHDINAAPEFFEPWEEGGSPRFWREMADPMKQEFTIGASWGGIGVVTAC